MVQPILPSQIVKYLDEQYPQAKKQLVEKGGQFYLVRAHAPKVRQILSMIKNIPPKLLSFDDDSHTEFGEAISAIQCAIDAWNSGDNQYKLQKIPGREKMHPFTVLRKHLVKLKDEELGNRGGKEKMVNISKVTPDRRKVFVVHGRNNQLRSDFFSFLRALDLKPIEWSEAIKLTGIATPYIGEAIDSAFKNAQAIIVLLSPDDEVRLSPELWKDKEDKNETNIKLQARPNVLFEAGMAFGTNPLRTLLIEVGDVKAFSDVAGRHVVRLSNAPEKRKEIAERLKTAGCDVSTSGDDWLGTGNFDIVRDKQTDSFLSPEIDFTAYNEVYKHFTNQLNYAIGRYKGYVSNLAPENEKYTEVGVWERINEVKSARMQLLSVCGEHVRSILLEAGTDWLEDIDSFGKNAPLIMNKLSEIAFKDRE